MGCKYTKNTKKDIAELISDAERAKSQHSSKVQDQESEVQDQESDIKLKEQTNEQESEPSSIPLQLDFDLDKNSDEIYSDESTTSVICLGRDAPLEWEKQTTEKKQKRSNLQDLKRKGYPNESIVVKKICRNDI